MGKIKIVLWLIVLLLGGFLMAKANFDGQNNAYKRILLLGASVGKEWDLPRWSQRMQIENYIFEMIAVYQFDKGEALNEILMRPKRKFRFTRSYFKNLLRPAPQKPAVIIIKECAAYFPGEFETYKSQVKKWMDQCKVTGIKPILATVVPVTKEHSQSKPCRLDGILEYNDWIRIYSKETGIGCLDLEGVLRVSESDRTLRPDLTNGDGLHLNKKAYEILDEELRRLLISSIL